MTLKPTLVSLAALACCGLATEALAQSSVTLFGVMDMSVQRVTSDGTGTTTRLVSGSNQTSRLGFRGVEDLGDGLKAGFWLEGGINGDTGGGAANNTNNQASGAVAAGGMQFDRRSTLSLSNRLGELRLGRDYVPTYWNVSKADPFFANGIGSDRNLTGAGAITAVTFVRASNSVGYHLPDNLGGVYGQAMVALGENASNTANKGDGRYAAARLGYASGPLDVAVATGKTQYLAGDFALSNAMAIYDFGAVKVSGLWNTSNLRTPVGQKQRDLLLAAVLPVGLSEFKLSYVKSSITTSANGSGARLLALGYVYNLSKRTAVYAHYGRIANQGSATFTNGATAPTAGGVASGVEVGVRHFF